MKRMALNIGSIRTTHRRETRAQLCSQTKRGGMRRSCRQTRRRTSASWRLTDHAAGHRQLSTRNGHRDGRGQRARAVRKRATPLAYIPETLPIAAEVTSIAPSATPTRPSVRIHGRCRIYARYRIHPRCRINRIFINHHWRRRHDDRPANHDEGSRLLDNDRWRRPVLVRGSLPP